jgi:NAD(P)-dependent dehydrogenase (short-subunit alcohol dehydrogenase family)
MSATSVRGTVVVTGAGSGVGRAVALRFAREDWQVALVGRRRAPLSETVSLAPSDAQGRCAVYSCDVSQADAVEAMATDVLMRFGHVDVLVNSAGINVPRRSFRDLSNEDWHAVLATNLSGAFYCVQAFLPSMRERSTGTVVNINSDVGKLARDLAGAAYVSSKFGLTGLTQQLNAEERANGIRACSVFPRDINTPLLDRRPVPPSPEARARMMQPDDVAECVWLAATLPSRAIVEEISLSSR